MIHFAGVDIGNFWVDKDQRIVFDERFVTTIATVVVEYQIGKCCGMFRGSLGIFGGERGRG